MGRPLVTACVLCLLCATHAHCSSNHESNSEVNNAGSPESSGDGGGSMTSRGVNVTNLSKQVSDNIGDGKETPNEGFTKICAIQSSNNSDSVVDNSNCCEIKGAMAGAGSESSPNSKSSTEELLKCLKPFIKDHSGHNDHDDEYHQASALSDQAAVWIYATISVIMISLCGLLAVAVIPLMHHGLYQCLIQFLVALAVGTLCGDALLHLLPHAMMSHHVDHDHSKTDHVHSERDHAEQHSINIWRGLCAALAIVFFYLIEKCLAFIGQWRKRNERKRTITTKVRVMREDKAASTEGGSRVGEKLCKHKYSSYPYCYGEITNNAVLMTLIQGPKALKKSSPTYQSMPSFPRPPEDPFPSDPDPDVHTSQGTGDPEIIAREDMTAQIISNHRHEDNEASKEDVPSSEKQLLGEKENRRDYTTVILREHETRHHGHAHTHGHVHSAPNSLSSVAWMVVLGDGIHNFTDGLAIGAAFASNIGGGFSTAVAVFCHELPHELGDFAMLLKAGMSAKEAVFYNLLSSVLCLFGMCMGVVLGHNEEMSLWVFSAAAGMFLYIALVDMIPELSSSHAMAGSSLYQGLLQLGGLLSGIFIMVVIAVFEHDLKNAFIKNI